MNKICDKELCTACKACLNACPRHCIEMVNDDLDTPYPKIYNKSCIDCGLCRKLCPNNNVLNFHLPRKVLAAWSLNSETRRKSASGGIAAELYKYAIENHWYAFGVAINRHQASYIEVNSAEDIEKVRNSKYVYSDTSDCYIKIKELIKSGQKVLFVGLPCQVAGLYSFLGKQSPNLITVDLVCHGATPSEYLKQHIQNIEEHKKRKTDTIYFRNPDFFTYTYHFTLSDSNGIFYNKEVYEDDVYQLGYHKALTYRENCYHCKYAQQMRIGDLTICDFSAIGQIIPVNYDRMNVSCVLVNTDTGEKIIELLGDRIFFEQRPRREAFSYEPQLNHPYDKHPARDVFTSEYKHTHNFYFSAYKALKEELNYHKPSVFQKLGKKIKYRIEASSIYKKSRCNVARFINHPSAPFGAILMLHRVDTPEDNGIWFNQHLKISPETIETMVAYARKKKCSFVSLDEMAEVLESKKKRRRIISITLDDGYRDNYTNGYPIFTKLDVPFTIYVCTKMVKCEMLYWWEILEQLVLSHDKIILSDGRSFLCTNKEEKENAFLDIREIIINLPQNQLEDNLKRLFANYDINYKYGNKCLGLTWEQINDLNKSYLATIGNHTFSHHAFTGSSDNEIISDILLANAEMERNTGLNMQHFAFPFGEANAVSTHDIELVKQLGFRTSATTKEDFVRYKSNPLDLPRFFVTEKNWKQVIDKIIEFC